MKRTFVTSVIVAAIAVVVPAKAQPVSEKPEMVLIPRQVAEAALQWVASPDATNAVRLYASLSACLGANPVRGVLVRSGPDQCSAVTDALAERQKELDAAKASKAEPPK